jgi:hypothetical protein
MINRARRHGICQHAKGQGLKAAGLQLGNALGRRAPRGTHFKRGVTSFFMHRVTFNEAVECFFEDCQIRRNKRYRDRYQLIGTRSSSN